MSPNATLAVLGHAISGSAGTAVSTAAVFPLDLATTRLKAQRMLRGAEHYDGVLDALRAIIKLEGGLSALYNGLGADVAKSLIDSFLFFGFYSYLRSRNRQPSIAQELATGAFAGACTKALTTPISTVVTRMQMSSQPKILREALSDVRNDMGIVGLWSGYSATLFLTLNPSITFFVNRRLAKGILPVLEEEDFPVAWVAFLLAAFSKATATAVTYPFQAGKLRLQMPRESADEEQLETDDRPQLLGRRASFWSLLCEMLDKTVIGVILKIVRSGGRRALYDGLQGELLKGFLSHGLTMLMKGFFYRLAIRLWFIKRDQRRHGIEAM
ncbi:hypothetical protein CDD83_4749 [Cordyceps sp. RAO-2017]|nr:hypothetical protein CDD83_4749 [Cordyceps sp. RAO-2017]